MHRGGAIICSTCWGARTRIQTQPMKQLQQQPPKQRHSRWSAPLETHMEGNNYPVGDIHGNQPAGSQSVGYPTADGGDDIRGKLPFPPHAISNSPNPEHGAATFCRSGTGHIQHHSRWRRSPALWMWWRLHRKPWRWLRMRSICTTNLRWVWRNPPIC